MKRTLMAMGAMGLSLTVACAGTGETPAGITEGAAQTAVGAPERLNGHYTCDHVVRLTPDATNPNINHVFLVGSGTVDVTADDGVVSVNVTLQERSGGSATTTPEQTWSHEMPWAENPSSERAVGDSTTIDFRGATSLVMDEHRDDLHLQFVCTKAKGS